MGGAKYHQKQCKDRKFMVNLQVLTEEIEKIFLGFIYTR